MLIIVNTFFRKEDIIKAVKAGKRNIVLTNRLENIGLNIRKYRKQMKLSQVELAVEVGIDRAYLSEIENGRTNPSVNVLYAIADALKIEIENLFATEFKI